MGNKGGVITVGSQFTLILFVCKYRRRRLGHVTVCQHPRRRGCCIKKKCPIILSEGVNNGCGDLPSS